MRDIEALRAHAIGHSLHKPTALVTALKRLPFVQADPICSPSRAQDLILRLRVKGYRAGDLERRYPQLDLEENMLYAYGFAARSVHQLLHPRPPLSLSALDREVLNAVRERGPLHPRELADEFGSERVVNAWGGYSKATKRSLERLHRGGLLRIARRQRGIRVYAAATPIVQPLSPRQRLRRLALVMAGVFAPVREKLLRSLLATLRRSLPQLPPPRPILANLVATGELAQRSVEDVSYLWPAARRRYPSAPQRVRFLAPFDPLVWDRQRFE